LINGFRIEDSFLKFLKYFLLNRFVKSASEKYALISQGAEGFHSGQCFFIIFKNSYFFIKKIQKSVSRFFR